MKLLSKSVSFELFFAMYILLYLEYLIVTGNKLMVVCMGMVYRIDNNIMIHVSKTKCKCHRLEYNALNGKPC